MEAATPGQPGDEVNRAEAAAGESDPTQAATPDQVTEPEGGPDSPPRGESPLDGQSQHASPTPSPEHPEVFVGAAFAGGVGVGAWRSGYWGPSE